MKSFSIIISIVASILFSSSCTQVKTGTLDYKRLVYDTNRITIFKWDTTKWIFPNNSSALALTQEDLLIVDSLLKNAIDSFNINFSPKLYEVFDRKLPLDSFIIKPERYRFQYFPMRDVNDHHIIKIIGFSTQYGSWKTEVYIPRIHYGITMLELNINISKKSRGEIITGSYG